VDFHTYWDSKPSDYILYHKITLRVQHALEALNEQYRQENELKFMLEQLRQEQQEQRRMKLEAQVEQDQQKPAEGGGKKAGDQQPKL
jgi:hypothetical protein